MSSDATLICGANPDTLLAQVADGHGAERDAHQLSCQHCQAALAEYSRLWAGVDELAATKVKAPPGLFEKALAMVREQTSPAGYGRLADTQGLLLVAARVVVAVAGRTARSSAGVRMALGALGELSDAAPAAVAAGLSGQSVALELNVAAEYGHDLRHLADSLRTRIAREVRAQTGLEVVSVDVTISDVFPRLEPPSSTMNG